MSRTVARTASFQPLLRQAGLLAAISLVLALALVGYVYGIDGQYFTRLFGSFFVLFWLLAVTFLAAVPFVSWAAANWFGSAWADGPNRPAPKARKNPPAPTAARTAPRTTARPKPSNHNHS